VDVVSGAGAHGAPPGDWVDERIRLDRCGEGQSPEGDLDGGSHQESNVIR
jgi:hypothetical protein